MSTDRDTTRIVRSWLEEGVTALPDRVLDAVLDQVPATSQRRPFWSAWRFLDMNSYTKLAIGAAAVLAVVVLGYNLLPRNPNVGSQPTPSPSPTARPFPSAGALEPGRYLWTVSGIRVTVEVPSGWVVGGDGGVSSGSDAESFEWGPVTDQITGVYADACKDTTLNVVGPGAADLAAALEQQLGTAAVVKTIDLGGVAATRIDLAAEAGLDRSKCSEGAEGPIKIWRFPGEAGYYALGPGVTGTIVTLDVRGTRLVFNTAKTSAASAADVAELDAMIASMVIAP